MIEAVIFDLGGTLINLPIDYQKLFEEIRKITKMYAIHPLTKVIAQLHNENKKKVFEAWSKNELEALENSQINKEGVDHYWRFSEKRKALITMQGKLVVQMVLQRLGLSFDFIITREESLDRVEQLKIAAKNLETPIENILFIGNTEGDMLASEIVGCQFLKVGK